MEQNDKNIYQIETRTANISIVLSHVMYVKLEQTNIVTPSVDIWLPGSSLIRIDKLNYLGNLRDLFNDISAALARFYQQSRL